MQQSFHKFLFVFPLLHLFQSEYIWVQRPSAIIHMAKLAQHSHHSVTYRHRNYEKIETNVKNDNVISSPSLHAG